MPSNTLIIDLEAVTIRDASGHFDLAKDMKELFETLFQIAQIGQLAKPSKIVFLRPNENSPNKDDIEQVLESIGSVDQQNELVDKDLFQLVIAEHKQLEHYFLKSEKDDHHLVISNDEAIQAMAKAHGLECLNSFEPHSLDKLNDADLIPAKRVKAYIDLDETLILVEESVASGKLQLNPNMLQILKTLQDNYEEYEFEIVTSRLSLYTVCGDAIRQIESLLKSAALRREDPALRWQLVEISSNLKTFIIKNELSEQAKRFFEKIRQILKACQPCINPTIEDNLKYLKDVTAFMLEPTSILNIKKALEGTGFEIRMDAGSYSTGENKNRALVTKIIADNPDLHPTSGLNELKSKIRKDTHYLFFDDAPHNIIPAVNTLQKLWPDQFVTYRSRHHCRLSKQMMETIIARWHQTPAMTESLVQPSRPRELVNLASTNS